MTFEGKRENSQRFANFEQFYKSYCAENSDNLVTNSMRDENLRGEGFKNSVYRIPENDKFLLRVKKRSQNPSQIVGLQKVVDSFPELNLGQRVAKLNDDVTVIVAQSGTPCGNRHWEGSKLLGINKTDLPIFVNSLEKISKFPQYAYDNLAKEVKLIFKKK